MKYLLMIMLLVAGPALAETADDPTNLEALKRGAEQGKADAQYELGVLYEFGFKFPDHKAAAYAWYNRAADQGNEPAVKRRDALKPQLSPAELERAAQLTKPSVPASAPADPASVKTPAPVPAPTPAVAPAPK